ncbi:MAG TPA: hypothetical protein VGL83_17375 [Stellaceae bacterium]|jgi:hypothetical protein
MSLTRAIPVFSVVFLIVYATVMYFNLAPFSYYPLVGQFAGGVAPTTPALGPAMYWYGWLAVALVIAVPVAAIVGFATSENAMSRLASVAPWLAILVVAFFLWVLRSWFIH